MGNQIRKLEPLKYIQDDEIVLVFLEKSGSRFITRTKIDKILLSYLCKSGISLPFSTEKELQLNLMKILGFLH
jgi:hypothetical protein